MANIMITKRCNLKCPYCFANEFVNKNSTDMTINNFLQALDFIMTDTDENVGIIGGEPTIHPEFKTILEILIEDDRVEHVTIFTNGINIDKYINQIVHPKFSILINCNNPNDMGEESYKKMVENIDLLVNQFYLKDRVTLGVNIYKEDFDYTYILDLLKQFKFDYLRTSISVPNTEELKNTDAVSYFMKMKEHVLKFYYDVLALGTVPYYDCNMTPSCILDNRQKEKLEQAIRKTGKEDKNLLCDVTNCEPVIDILPDLKAIRCFALSEYNKAEIKDYENINELKAYFANLYDVFGYNVASSEICKDCHMAKIAKCSGGCYAFKIKKMIQAHKAVARIK